MKIGIDATNLNRGGGITHLVNLLDHLVPERHGIDKIILWGNKKSLSKIENKPWIKKVNLLKFEKSFIYRIYWNFYKLKIEAKKEKCSLLFFPGGLFFTSFKPVVTMSRNMLPFELNELKRFGFSKVTIRYLFLFIFQSAGFVRANRLIFLSKYARDKISKILRLGSDDYCIIPHGVNNNLYKLPVKQKPFNAFSVDDPFRLLYISIVNKYKHQNKVITAITKLRNKGLPITLDLIGPAYKPALKEMKKAMAINDPDSTFINYHGEKPYNVLIEYYHKADGFIFASSCENMPNILLEAMASGLPIASSNKGPMPEILKDGGVYFDPENIESISNSLSKLFYSHELREKLSNSAYNYSKKYSWDKCADRTYYTLLDTVQKNS